MKVTCVLRRKKPKLERFVVDMYLGFDNTITGVEMALGGKRTSLPLVGCVMTGSGVFEHPAVVYRTMDGRLKISLFHEKYMNLILDNPECFLNVDDIRVAYMMLEMI